MRYGIFSDVHANLDALEAVLRSFEREKIDALVCLGDTVGYGAQPNYGYGPPRPYGYGPPQQQYAPQQFAPVAGCRGKDQLGHGFILAGLNFVP